MFLLTSAERLTGVRTRNQLSRDQLPRDQLLQYQLIMKSTTTRSTLMKSTFTKSSQLSLSYQLLEPFGGELFKVFELLVMHDFIELYRYWVILVVLKELLIGFAWIEFIQREESVTKAKIQSFRTGATSCQRRHRVKEKEKRIQTLIDRFNAGNISLNKFLGAIKHQTGFN